MSENAVKFDLIDAFRERLDEIDEALVPLLEERLKIVAEIGAVKRERGLEIEDLQRERRVYKHIEALVHDPAKRDQLKAIYHEIIRISKDMQIRR